VNLALAQNPGSAQQPSAKGEMKQSGSEVKEAGKSASQQAKNGRMVSGAKDFGKHMGRAGKHFGQGVKKGAKKAAS
jgi:hypothetical protein